MKPFPIAVMSLFLIAAEALASPADYVHAPIVEHGETEIGLKFGALHGSDAGRATAAAFGIGHGVTPWWSTELYAVYARGSASGTELDGFEWENTFVLLPPGRHPVAIGFITEFERAQDRREGYELIFGPLFQAEFGRARINFNLLFSQTYRTERKQPTGMGYQFQARFPLNEDFGAGVQGFGEMGKWNHWAATRAQSHRLGPAFFGTLRLGDEHKLVYNAAILFEAANQDRRRTLRSEVSYEF